MSDGSASGFNARTMVLLVLAGIVGFGAFLLLAAYAPQLSSGRDGRAHGLSTSAVGFRGLYELLVATGEDADYLRDENVPYGTGLVILTLDRPPEEERLARLLERGENDPTLVVLPKWATVPDPSGARDRVQWADTGIGAMAVSTLGEIGPLSVSPADVPAGAALPTEIPGASFRAPERLQTISGKNLAGMIRTENGGIVLGQVVGTQIYLLADPDLVNNLAMASPGSAEAALRLVDDLNAGRGAYVFDLVFNGFAGSPNLLTLAFEPPFLALTLCILAAALLAGFQAAYRFGPALREPRAIAFGKRALVDNSAELLRLARREHLSSERYAANIRDEAVAAIGNPRRLEGAELDRWLDRFEAPGLPRFTELKARATNARGSNEILGAARALHKWKRTVTHEG